MTKGVNIERLSYCQIIQWANSKIHQLNIAHQIELEIPKTILINNPEEAKRFISTIHGPIVTKPLSRGYIDDNNQPGAIYTNLIETKHLERIQQIRYTPPLFQEYVPKDVELRITIVGKNVFTAEIHSQQKKETRHDWRHDTLALEHREHPLPDDIKLKCIQLAKMFDLEFGAIDMILTPDGRYVFLEINPNGQWAWIEEMTGLPISEAMIELLRQGKSIFISMTLFFVFSNDST